MKFQISWRDCQNKFQNKLYSFKNHFVFLWRIKNGHTLKILLAIIALVIMVLTGIVAIKRQDVKGCMYWQKLEREQAGFVVSEQMNMLCDQYGISFNP